MGSPEGASTRPRPHVVPWLAALAGALGGFTAGIGGNLIAAEDYAYRGFAVLSAVVAILWTAARLREFESDFVLVVCAVRGCLLIAVAAVVAATVVDTALSGIMVLVAALATLGATVIRTDADDRLVFLGAVALIGTGASFLAEGISSAELTGEGRVFTIATGGLIALFGIAAMAKDRTVVRLVRFLVHAVLDDPIPFFHMIAAFFAFMGVLAAAQGEVLLPVAMGLSAIGAAGMRIGHTRRRPEVVGPAAMLAGVGWVLIGTWGVTEGDVLLGAAAAGLGFTVIVAGWTYLSRRKVLGRVRRWLDAARREP